MIDLKSDNFKKPQELKFPSNLDSFNDSTIKEIYSKLLSNYNLLSNESKHLNELLKKEKFFIQELKNENMLLKQKIDNENLKNLVIKNTNEDKKNLNDQKLFDNVSSKKDEKTETKEILNLKINVDKLRKELILSQAITNNFKSELDNVKVLNDNFKTENEILSNNIKELKGQLDKIMMSKKEEDNEKQKIVLEHENLKIEHQKLLESNKNNSANIYQKFQELSKKYENNNEATLSHVLEVKRLNEKLILEQEEIKKQLKNAEEEKNNYLSELNFERENISHMQNNIEEKLDLIRKLKKEISETNKKSKEIMEENRIIVNNCNCEEMAKNLEEKYYEILSLNKTIVELNSELGNEKKKFEEIFYTQSKKNEEFLRETRIYSEEKFNLISNIENIKKNIEKIEEEKAQSIEQIQQKEKEIFFLQENIQKLQKEKDLITNNRNAIQNDFNQLSNQYNFLKDKFEKDIKNKNDEINEVNLSLENFKREILREKESKKSLKYISLNNEDTVDNLQNKITELQIKEKDYISKLNNIDLIHNEKVKLEKTLEENMKIILFWENKNKENKLKIDNLSNENSNFKEENLLVRKEQNTINDQVNKKLVEDLNLEIKKLNDFNNCLVKEKENLLNNSFKFKMEMNSKQEMIEKLFKENKMLSNEMLGIKSGAFSLFSQLKIVINRLNSLLNKDPNCMLDKNFSQKICKFSLQINIIKQENLDENFFDNCCNMLEFLCKEFENCFDSLQQVNQEIYKRNSMHHENKKTIEINEMENEKLNLKISQLMNEINSLYSEIDQYKERQISLLNEINEIKKCGFNDNSVKTKLENEINSQVKEKNEIRNENLRLENEYEIVLNDKKKSEELLNIIGKNFPCKNTSKLINDNLALREFIRKNETENIKLNERIFILDQECLNLEKEKSSKNLDLFKSVKAERDNLRKLSVEYEKKIGEKKEIIKAIDDDLTKKLTYFRIKFNNFLDFESKFKNEKIPSDIDTKPTNCNSINNKSNLREKVNNYNSNFLETFNSNKINFIGDKYSFSKFSNDNFQNFKNENPLLKENDLQIYNNKYYRNEFENENENSYNNIYYNYNIQNDNINSKKLQFSDEYNRFNSKNIKLLNSTSENLIKNSISNLEITSLNSINDIPEQLRFGSLEKRSLIESISEEQIINNEAYDYKINKFKTINAYNSDRSDIEQNHNQNYSFRNPGSELEDLINLKSNEFYNNVAYRDENSLFLSETNCNSRMDRRSNDLKNNFQFEEYDNDYRQDYNFGRNTNRKNL